MFTHTDEICDEFEAVWANGGEPDLQLFIAKATTDERRALAIELAEIDMFRRWDHDVLEKRRSLTHYLSVLQDLAPNNLEISQLVECFYTARFESNDNPVAADFDKLGLDPSIVANGIQRARKVINWPVLRVVASGATLAETPLDVPIDVGRQRASDPPPHSIVDQQNERRVIIAPSSDPSVSRNQLRVELLGCSRVMLHNSSRNRAIGLRRGNALAAGGSLESGLPVIIPLATQSIVLTAKS